jgi:DNA-binding NarL/FixJ family response regulator
VRSLIEGHLQANAAYGSYQLGWKGRCEMRVLMADHQTSVRSALRRLLFEVPGFLVVGEAIRAGDLLDQAIATQPDLVLLDWELPGLSVKNYSTTTSLHQAKQARHNLLVILHSLHSRPKVIALSGRPEVRQAALDAGADAFVSKGDSPERLITTLRTIDNYEAVE